jgi:UDP-N-acetylglucosamine diphosphorylase/glucosamine-1-phosphate N-acetyltransferase
MKYIEGKPAIVILAAGMGKRMKSRKAKVLHKILGKPMIMYVVETARKVAGNDVILVIGNQAEKVRAIVSENEEVIYALQKEQLGTGHAVLCALPYIPDYAQEVVILCGDVPLITSDTIIRFIEDHVKAKRDLSLLAVEMENPEGYGRILLDENRQVYGIIEEADASDEQKEIKIVNTGIYCLKKELLSDLLQKIKSDNVQGEYYLTDIVKIGYNEERVVGAMVCSDCEEVVGINNSQDLMTAESIMRSRITNIP